MVKKRTRNKKWLWIGMGIIAVAILIGVGVAIGLNNNNTSYTKANITNNNDGISEEQKQELKNSEQNGDESFAEEEVEKKKVVQYEGDDPNKSDELAGVITYAGVNNGVLMIRVSIDQYLTSGTCNLTLNRNGTTIYNSDANILGDVSTATCEGFDIPVAELGSGDVDININLSADGKSGAIRGEVGI